MGFLGFGGYSEKTFNKNNALIAQQLTTMMEKTIGKMGIGSTLNSAIRVIQSMPYPTDARNKKLDSAPIEKIDNRIFDLIQKLYSDLQQGKLGKMAAHANMIFEAVEARTYGQEQEGELVLKYKERIAELNAILMDNLTEQEKVQQEKARIEKKVDGMDEDSAEFQKYELEYANWERKEESLKEQFQNARAEYNQTAEELNVALDEKAIDEIPAQVTSTRELGAMIERVTMKRQKMVQERLIRRDMTGEYGAAKKADMAEGAVTQTGGLRAKKQAQKEEEMSRNIANAPAGASVESGSSAEKSSSLKAAIKK